MNSRDTQRLQAAADSIESGLALVTVTTSAEAVVEGDRRKGHEGENRLAERIPCVDCAGDGEVLDADGLPDVCPTCEGKGYTMGPDPTVDVDTVTIDLGHAVTVSVATLEGDGRIDRRRLRSIDEIEELVRLAVGQVALEVARGSVDGAEADALLDVAARAGAIGDAEAAEMKQARGDLGVMRVERNTP